MRIKSATCKAISQDRGNTMEISKCTQDERKVTFKGDTPLKCGTLVEALFM